MKIELHRFRVFQGKSQVVDEWLNFLNQHMEDTLLTLEDEKMYVESIHREVLDGTEYLYWYIIQGEGGRSVKDSTSYIDIQHLKYWKECIDPSYKAKAMPALVAMIPHRVRESF